MFESTTEPSRTARPITVEPPPIRRTSTPRNIEVCAAIRAGCTWPDGVEYSQRSHGVLLMLRGDHPLGNLHTVRDALVRQNFTVTTVVTIPGADPRSYRCVYAECMVTGLPTSTSTHRRRMAA